jgi:enoyl-CoA hydratase
MPFLSLKIQDNKVGLLTIERPDALNALNESLLLELEEVLTKIANEPSIKVLVITGQGRAFVAGADIAAMQQMSPLQAEEFSLLGQRVFSQLATLSQPTIAAVNGFALGGGLELALACDLRVASEKAKLGQPEIGLGIIPGFGATQRLPRLIGVAQAKELLFTGATISAGDALALGLVNRILPPDQLLDAALDLANNIAKHSGVILKHLKRAVDMGADETLAAGQAIETQQFGACFATHDQKEGMGAFLEKRQAQFLDR